MITRRSFFKGLGTGIACLGLGVKFGVEDVPLAAKDVPMTATEVNRRVKDNYDLITRRFIEDYQKGFLELATQKESRFLKGTI